MQTGVELLLTITEGFVIPIDNISVEVHKFAKNKVNNIIK